MKAVIQRVSEARVIVDGRIVDEIGEGCLVLAGIEKGDTINDLMYMAGKIARLRIFEDEGGRMNKSLKDIGGELLVVSQFTLAADCRKGNRPSFDNAEEPEKAKAMYVRLVGQLREEGIPVCTGEFGAHMKVHLVNDGPVTIILDSRRQIQDT